MGQLVKNLRLQLSLNANSYCFCCLAVWDGRKGDNPILQSPVENSHYEPITHFHWLMSKTGSECVTTSTDGHVMWWDTRKFEAGPVEKLSILEGFGDVEEVVGGTALEYNVEAGVKN